MTVINMAEDFSLTPAGRSEKDHGPNSAETFRKKLLAPKLRAAIENQSMLVVELDGVAGYPAVFLDEAFGGLVREDRFKQDKVLQHLEIKVETYAYEVYKQLCLDYIRESKPRIP